MAQLGEAFRPDEVEDTGFDCLPAGDYMAQVVESTLGPNKNNNGDILTLVLEIIEGQYANRKVWIRLNYTNPSAQAQQISRGTLKMVTLAVGHQGELLDTEDLHFKPFIASLKIRKDKGGQYDDQNDLAKAKPIGANDNGARRGPIGNGGQRAAATRPAASPTARPGAAAGGRPAATGPGGRPWPARPGAAAQVDDEIPF